MFHSCPLPTAQRCHRDNGPRQEARASRNPGRATKAGSSQRLERRRLSGSSTRDVNLWHKSGCVLVHLKPEAATVTRKARVLGSTSRKNWPAAGMAECEAGQGGAVPADQFECRIWLHAATPARIEQGTLLAAGSGTWPAPDAHLRNNPVPPGSGAPMDSSPAATLRRDLGQARRQCCYRCWGLADCPACAGWWCCHCCLGLTPWNQTPLGSLLVGVEQYP